MHAIVLSGGSGTRLWPVSRSSFPKQFNELLDESLLAKTIKRLRNFESVSIVTSLQFKTLTERTVLEIQPKIKHILFEPTARNTAPAIAWIVSELLKTLDPEQVVGVFPADHLIENENQFKQSLEIALETARQGQIVTLGLQPTYPSTGYGYIEISGNNKGDASLKPLPSVFSTKGFHEKPNLEKANEFLNSGSHYWNAGIFFFQLGRIREEFLKHLPKIWQAVSESADLNPSPLAKIYEGLESISFDHGIMEKADRQSCVVCDIGWSDVGSWDELSRLTPDKGVKVESQAENNFVFGSPGKIYALLGVKDVILVDTEDALMVSRRGMSQQVRDIVKKVESTKPSLLKEHRFEIRPWGRFEILRDSDQFKSKIIQLDGGKKFSYQSHQHRSEHWVIVKGIAKVLIDEKEFTVKEGESIYVPKGAKHRMSNPGKEPLEFIEVQVGDYFGEDDIIRFQDDYGRS